MCYNYCGILSPNQDLRIPGQQDAFCLSQSSYQHESAHHRELSLSELADLKASALVSMAMVCAECISLQSQALSKAV